jgi:hypothetical protein
MKELQIHEIECGYKKISFVHITNGYISNTKHTFKICMLIWALHYLEDVCQIKPQLKYTKYENLTKLSIFHDIMLKNNEKQLSKWHFILYKICPWSPSLKNKQFFFQDT